MLAKQGFYNTHNYTRLLLLQLTKHGEIFGPLSLGTLVTRLPGSFSLPFKVRTGEIFFNKVTPYELHLKQLSPCKSNIYEAI